MGKGKRVKIKLVSEAETGYFYTTDKNPSKSTEKLRFKKYDPRAIIEGEFDTNGDPRRGKYVWFKEAKIK